jgi:hypothetical protein
MIRNSTNLALVISAGLCFAAIARGDEIQFATLPQTVQTTVIRETRIADGSSVTRITRDSNGIYMVTVRGTTGEQLVSVNEAGLVVQAPVTTTVVQKSVETVQPAEVQAPGSTTVIKKVETVEPAQVQAPVTTVVQKPVETVQPAVQSPQTVVTYDQVQQNVSRYQLIEKKGKKEVYRDNQTGQKVTVKRENK